MSAPAFPRGSYILLTSMALPREAPLTLRVVGHGRNYQRREFINAESFQHRLTRICLQLKRVSGAIWEVSGGECYLVTPLGRSPGMTDAEIRAMVTRAGVLNVKRVLKEMED